MSGDLNQPSGTDVVAVVVTWNRRDLLRESLRAIAPQTHPPRRIVVVDNASDDGTATMLRADFARRRRGDRAAQHRWRRRLRDGPGRARSTVRLDAVWLMDDDTVPEPAALAAMLEVARARYAGGPPCRWSRPGSSGPTAATTR